MFPIKKAFTKRYPGHVLKGGLATIYMDGEEVVKGRIDKTQPAVFSADETADVGLDDTTQVADKVFKDLNDSNCPQEKQACF